MKTEELKAQGLTQEQINFVMAENGKDIDKIQKKLDDMTVERDKEKGRADTAERKVKHDRQDYSFILPSEPGRYA